MGFKNILLILSSVLLNAGAQLFIKKGMSTIGGVQITLHELFSMVLKAMTNIYIYLGMSAYALSIVLWMVVLSRVNVSLAYPFQGVGYIVVVFMAYVLFGEILTLQKCLGVALIAMGLVALSTSRG